MQPDGALASSPPHGQGWRSLPEHANTAEAGQMCAAGGAVLVCTRVSVSATISKCSNLSILYVCVFLMVLCLNTEPHMQVIARKAECGSLEHRFVPLYMILFQFRSEGTGK